MDTVDPFQLQDIAPAEPFLLEPGLPWWGWLLILLALAAIAVVVVFLRRHRRHAAPPDLGKHLLAGAHARARQLIEESRTLPAREAATRISFALRGYLLTASGDPSLYETHEEFLARHHALDFLAPEARERLASTFSRLAAMKYDRHRSGNADSLATEALATLDQLHQTRRAA